MGPTLNRSEPLLTAPDMQAWPPVRHGDLYRPAIASGDTAVIVDGVYHQAPALRHKEILTSMRRGVRVIGAASIGALRAAELAPFGMLGVGSIYTAYARGDLDGDDEVAVGQTPDGAWGSLTWPVVNLRYILKLGQAAGVLDTQRAGKLLNALRAVYYPQRTMAAVQAICHHRDEREFGRWLAEQHGRDGHFGNLKRLDALAALRTALDGPAPLVGADRPPLVETTYMRRWSNHFATALVDGVELSTADRLVYQQVFDPRFSETWTAYLEHRSLQPADGGPGLPLGERLALVTGEDLAAHQVFHPLVDLRDEETVGLLLAWETPEDRQAVARYAEVLADARRTRAGFSTGGVRDDLTRRVLIQVWGCADKEFDAEASARGLVSGARAIDAAKPLLLGFLNERKEQDRAC
ncbi:TfuA-like protein [Streptomyces polygonati]|uniref:TfuA-like protein n=1 Tax=Streptomyces polygonati TaxID=1617087 RepID=A0ABV8HYD5_9ACTN